VDLVATGTISLSEVARLAASTTTPRLFKENP